MFSFKNLSNADPIEEPKFEANEYRVSHQEFLNKRRTSEQSYVFDLRTPEEYEISHFPGSHSLPIEHFENAIYQMPYSGDILLYGAGNQEAEKAAEVLYENGFDQFIFMDDYQAFLKDLSESNWTISDDAIAFLTEQGHSEVTLKALPISPKKAKYSISFDPSSSDPVEQAKYLKVSQGGITWHIDHESLLYLEGTQVEMNDQNQAIARNENFEVPPLEGDPKQKMQQLIDDQINPAVAAHGGFVELIDVKDDTVYLEFGGGCKGCGGVNMTLKNGVEVIVKENLPGITRILDVTDHANGENPYYKSEPSE